MYVLGSDAERDLYKNAMQYRKYHSKLVSDIALKILSLNSQVIPELQQVEQVEDVLYLACLLHDIKKFDEKHNKVGAKWFMENIDEYLDIDEESKKYIRKLISKHKLGAKLKKYKKELLYLILVIRVSDKLSKLKEKANYSCINEEQIRDIISKVKDKTLANSTIDLRKEIGYFFDNIEIEIEMIN